MKVTGKNSLSFLIKIVLQILEVLGICMLIFLPWILELYISSFRLDLENFYIPCLILLYVSAIPMLAIVWQAIKLFDLLKRNTPFVMENVKHLKIASICSGIIFVEYLIGIFLIKSVFIVLVVGIFFVLWIGLYIMSELFKQAVEYKEENDLTI